MIKARDQQRPFGKRVPAACGLDHVLGQNFKGERELLPEFVLPLLNQAAWGDDEATLDVAPDHELLAEQPGHDRLTGTRVVSQEKPEWLTWQHLFVDSFDLMWKRVEIRRLDGKERIEQVSERYPLRLGHEPEEIPVGVHRPGLPGRLDCESRFVFAIEQLL